MSPSLKIMCAAAALLVATTSPLQADVIYDANVDFIPNSPNPNGVWTYGYTTTLGGTFNVFNEYATGPNVYAWRTNLALGTPAFGYFTSPSNGVLAGETSLHGGPGGEFAVLRFTAPTTGIYDILATWRGPGDSNNTDLYVLANSNAGLPLGSTGSTTTSGSFPFSNVSLNAGETIDLVVGNGADGFFSDNTPVNLQITSSVPEPSSVVLLGIGLMMMVVGRWRCWLRVPCSSST